MLPSAAAGINHVGAQGERKSQQRAEPLVQKSLNTRSEEQQGGNKQPDNSQALSRQLLSAKKNLAKKEEEAAAFVQQMHSRNQKVVESEQKIQTLERMSKAQAAEIQSLKKEIVSTVGAVHAEKMNKLVDTIQKANSQLCEQFGSFPEVCHYLVSWMLLCVRTIHTPNSASTNTVALRVSGAG